MNKVLVIRLGALGDLVFCMRVFQSIRKHYKDSKTALLVRKPYAEFAKAMPWFDEIIIDEKPDFNISEWLGLRNKISKFKGDSDKITVYDFHCKKRQTILYFLFGGFLKTIWSGMAPFCKYRRDKVWTNTGHWIEDQKRQLEQSGIEWDNGALNLDWLDADITKFNLPNNLIVFIPGSSKHDKQWGSDKFIELANRIQKPICLVGSKEEQIICDEICSKNQNIINLCGKTSLFELAGILRKADLVIGGDTGPMHIASVLERKTIALYSKRTDAIRHKPIGTKTTVIQKQNMKDISLEEIINHADKKS